MGHDDQLSSMCYLVATPSSEPIKFENLKPIALEEDQDLDLTEKNKLIFNTAWTDTFNVKFKHHKMSKKTFKKWLMSNGFKRDLAELFCQIIASFGGRISYQSIYVDSFLVPTPHTLHHSITLEIHKLYEGVKKP